MLRAFFDNNIGGRVLIAVATLNILILLGSGN